tara:strand:+ start:243 stop:392 length:150 start_codon:yes stop_codon:yes gene_type:complete
MNFLKTIFRFIIKRKKFWLTPAILTLLALGALFVTTQGTIVAPFIYTLF